MSYSLLEAGGDAGIRAEGTSIEAAFREAALGMYSLVADLLKVEPREVLNIEVESHCLESLLIAWLNELVFHLDTKGFVGSRIEVTSLDTDSPRIEAIIAGEALDPERHGHGLLIKAATYHDLKLVKSDGHWAAEVLFDI